MKKFKRIKNYTDFMELNKLLTREEMDGLMFLLDLPKLDLILELLNYFNKMNLNKLLDFRNIELKVLQIKNCEKSLEDIYFRREVIIDLLLDFQKFLSGFDIKKLIILKDTHISVNYKRLICSRQLVILEKLLDCFEIEHYLEFLNVVKQIDLKKSNILTLFDRFEKSLKDLDNKLINDMYLNVLSDVVILLK
jgi:hypothetical protein